MSFSMMLTQLSLRKSAPKLDVLGIVREESAEAYPRRGELRYDMGVQELVKGKMRVASSSVCKE